MEYALNREPRLFQHTTFRVDKFHYNHNHLCCEMYSLDHYPESMQDFVNSSSAEIVNSYLETLKSQIAYMTQETCMRFFRFIFGYLNHNKNNVLLQSKA